MLAVFGRSMVSGTWPPGGWAASGLLLNKRSGTFYGFPALRAQSWAPGAISSERLLNNLAYADLIAPKLVAAVRLRLVPLWPLWGCGTEDAGSSPVSSSTLTWRSPGVLCSAGRMS